MISKVSLPEGTKGDWKISRFEINEQEAKSFNLGMLFQNQGARCINPGTYTKLTHREMGLVMSDTPAEMRDHYEIVRKATGKVLINGLGLGMVLQACLDKPEVEHLVVIEISKDLIDLVYPYYKKKYNKRLFVVHADALKYIPPKGERFNAVWHDIWNEINSDNWDEYKLLHRRYGRRTDWQGSWGRYHIRKTLRELRESRNVYSFFNL